jgi:hypothetical protein
VLHRSYESAAISGRRVASFECPLSGDGVRCQLGKLMFYQ